MNIDLTGMVLAVLGGDDREVVFVPELIKLGAKINIIGFDNYEGLEAANHCPSIEKAVENANAAIMPMPGTDEEGKIRAIYSKAELIFTENVAAKLTNKPLFIGVAKPYLKKLCLRYKVILIETAELDEIAILNSIPTAEGAIQIAMQETPFTIHNSNCFVLGYGRVGITLARMLRSLGAKTFVAARDNADLARAFEQGCCPVNFDDLKTEIVKADIIFNTVPAKVLDINILKVMDKNSLIIDLASAPGGTDFELAEKLGIKAILAPGLPGKVAPLTAGKILAQVLPKLIYQYVKA